MSEISPDISKVFSSFLLQDKSIESHLGTHHPNVQAWFYSYFSWLGLVPFVNIIWNIGLVGRAIWFLAHAWNYIWWGLLLGLFFEFFWLFVLDGWGWIKMDWIYESLAPKDQNGNYSIVDNWVKVNTWTFEYTIEVIEKDTGVTFDPTNETHMKKMKDYTWPYLHEQMNLLNLYESHTWELNTIWFLFCPQMYMDDDGYAKDGYPLMVAKSHELSKMYWGDYSWMQNPLNRKLKLDSFTFVKTFLNILWGEFIYFLNLLCGDIPAFVSIWS